MTYCLGSTFCQFTLPNTYHSLLDLFLTSFNLTRALKRVQVYLNYFHSTGTQQVAQTQLWLELSEVSKSRDSSNKYFTEAFTHSTFVIILYFTLFQEKNRKRNKQISRFVFIPEVNNKLTSAG